MTENQRQLIRDCAHRLRSRLTYVMLCSHTIKLDLHNLLSREHEEDFRKMAEAPEATRRDLNTLLKQFDQIPQKAEVPDGDEPQTIGAHTESENAA